LDIEDLSNEKVKKLKPKLDPHIGNLESYALLKGD